MPKNRINPVIKPVVETLQRTYFQTKQFAKSPDSAINGLLVMGDAGVGKSHFVKQALRDANVQSNVEYIKGGTITAAALYVKLFLNKDPNRIIVLDDVDIVAHAEKSKIVPMILGAVEEGRDRLVSWNTAKKNSLMEEYEVPFEFNFNGKMIVITNYTLEDIGKKLSQWKQAFSSRFNSVECIFNHEQKYMYTKHLVETEDMLGGNCRVHTYDVDGETQNGYPQWAVEEAIDFIDDNYLNFSDITPRVAVKVVDTIFYNNADKDMKRVMLSGLVQ